MKLFHMSLEVDEIIEEFVPRVPEMRLNSEDGETKRVCVSKSIKGGLSGIPNIVSRLEEQFDEDNNPRVRVYEFEYDETSENFIDSDTLYEKDLVMDSLETEECWILEKVKPVRTYIISIEGFTVACTDRISYENSKLIVENEDNDDFDIEDYIDGETYYIDTLHFKLEE